MDLVALNVQRGRDHGLAPYVKWRQLCGLRSVKSWKMYASIVASPEVILYPRVKYNCWLLYVHIKGKFSVIDIFCVSCIVAGTKAATVVWSDRKLGFVHRRTIGKKRW